MKNWYFLLSSRVSDENDYFPTGPGDAGSALQKRKTHNSSLAHVDSLLKLSKHFWTEMIKIIICTEVKERDEIYKNKYFYINI